MSAFEELGVLPELIKAVEEMGWRCVSRTWAPMLRVACVRTDAGAAHEQ